MATTMTTARTQAQSGVRSERRPISWSKAVIIFLALMCTFIAIAPFLFALTTSFKSQIDSIDGTVIPWLQYKPTLINWQQEFGSGGAETFKALRNSTLISLGATLVASTLGTLATGWRVLSMASATGIWCRGFCRSASCRLSPP
jgi:ABC-type glycerol-3-phosphate transport system permease component